MAEMANPFFHKAPFPFCQSLLDSCGYCIEKTVHHHVTCWVNKSPKCENILKIKKNGAIRYFRTSPSVSK